MYELLGNTCRDQGTTSSQDSPCIWDRRKILSVRGDLVNVPRPGVTQPVDIGDLFDQLAQEVGLDTREFNLHRPNKRTKMDLCSGDVCDFTEEEKNYELTLIPRVPENNSTMSCTSSYINMIENYPPSMVTDGKITEAELLRMLSTHIGVICKHGRGNANEANYTNATLFCKRFVKTYRVFPGRKFFARNDSTKNVKKHDLPWFSDTKHY